MNLHSGSTSFLDFFMMNRYIIHQYMGDRPTAGHTALDRRIGVRIPVSQPSKKLGRAGLDISDFSPGALFLLVSLPFMWYKIAGVFLVWTRCSVLILIQNSKNHIL